MPQLKRYHEIAGALHIGCEEPRAYFIPFENEEKSLLPRENSGRFTSLCGEWDFAFFENAARVDIESPSFPACAVCPDKIDVPRSWQMYVDRNYDKPNYINQDYPFPVDPPHIPDVVPCGLYRKSVAFTPADGKKYYIVFEGVSSCFYLWVNGSFAAYSQVSHATAEIDITAYLKNSKNTFEALVVKHCDGTYFEDQDFFRLSGIFREVYILERDAEHIEDIDIIADVSETLDPARLMVNVSGVNGCDLKLISPQGETVYEGENTVVAVDNPVLWNFETPFLYTLTLHSGSEYISIPVGFRRFEIKDSVVLLNGAKVKAKGVNRHDFNPETGYYVSEEQMLGELYSLKRANVNTIRTSHYPNDPRFLEMCDRLGFMVCDEADLETHGMGYNFGDWYWDYWAHLTDSPEYKEACVDRAKLLFERDKNHPCVIMWSLGNESGCGENHRAMADYIRSRRENAVIHYENAHLEYAARLGKDFSDISDVESRMYASTEYLKEYLENDSLRKPFFYCEYVDSMSTGSIYKHWDGFEKYDKYFGGCVWEYGDHAVNIGTEENPKYRYGGDFADWPNDGVYCLDGLVYPDRSPRPGYYDMKKAYEPFEISYEGGAITVKNKRYFTDFSDLSIEWTVEKNGCPFMNGKIEQPNIEAGESEKYNLFDEIIPGGFTTLNVYVRQKNGTLWAEKGYETGFAQFVLSDENPVFRPEKENEVTFTETRTDIIVQCGDTEYSFDRVTGKISGIKAGGCQLLEEPLSLSIYRAPVYSTPHLVDVWKRARYDRIRQKTYGVSVSKDGGNVIITADISLGSAAMPPAVKAKVNYIFTPDGAVGIGIKASVCHNAPALPRFGLSLVMDKSFDKTTYLGYGPIESYSERHRAARLSLYRTSPEKDYEHYIRPQECSSHFGTRYACVSGEKAKIEFFTDESFCFKAIPYDDATIINTAHDDELTDTGRTFVNIDCKLPQLSPDTEFSEKEFDFAVTLAPSGC